MRCIFGLRKKCPLEKFVCKALKEEDIQLLYRTCGLCIKSIYAKARLEFGKKEVFIAL